MVLLFFPYKHPLLTAAFGSLFLFTQIPQPPALGYTLTVMTDRRQALASGTVSPDKWKRPCRTLPAGYGGIADNKRPGPALT